MLDWALAYASEGLHVLPLHTPSRSGCSCRKVKCTSVGKHPRIMDWVKNATTDPITIRRWWSQWPDANIGIATGPGSGICVIDVDGINGRTAFEKLPSLPLTLRVNTGRPDRDGMRGSFHLYFRLPTGTKLRNSQGRLGIGIDVKNAGGYVVAPPSLHWSGLLYEHVDRNVPIALIPDWFMSKLEEAAASSTTLEQPHLLFDGARTQGLLRLAGKWRRSGIEPDTILAQLREQNMLRCRPPLPDAKVKGIYNSCLKWELGGPDPLKAAYEKVKSEEHVFGYGKFLSLASHLQKAQPGFPILLPVKRVSELLACDPTLISRYRARAQRESLLKEVEKYNHRSGRATKFLVLDTFEGAPTKATRSKAKASVEV